MADAQGWINSIVAACSLVISGFALFVGYKAQHKANALQQTVVDIEKQREEQRALKAAQAQLRAELRRDGRSDRLAIINEGLSEARNVCVEMDGVPLAERGITVSGDSLPGFVGPQGENSCLVVMIGECSPPFDTKITWDDDSGQRRVYHTVLTR